MNDTKDHRFIALKSIRDELIAWEDAPLYGYRTENNYFPVVGEGSHHASIMFVGEAPGENEAKTGRPFCGAAGRILDEMLASIELNREDVYITNIVKDRPPSNRDPLPEEIEAYAPFLNRQIDIIQPKVIATLGRHSMGYVMQLLKLGLEIEPISKIHGKTFTGKTSYGDVIYVALYHPAVALYRGSMKEQLFEDAKALLTQ